MLRSLAQAMVALAYPALLCANSVTCPQGLCDLGNLGSNSTNQPSTQIGSTALAINDNGQVTGYGYVSGTIYNTYLFTPNANPLTGGNTVDLDTSIQESNYPSALSSNGYVAGTAYQTIGQDAFVYTGGTTPLATLSPLGGILANGGGINSSGNAVGISTTNTSQTPVFYWDGTSMHNVGTLGSSALLPVFINNNGQIAGNSNASQAFFAANYQSALQAITLGGSGSTATGMNSSGQVVGQSSTSSSPTQVAFIYTPGTGAQNIGTQWSGINTYYGASDALAVNDYGVAAGQAYVSATNYHAVIFSQVSGNYVMTDLGTLNNGAGNSTATAINNNGWVVGTATNSTGGTDPFLYLNGQMIDLNSPQFLAGTGFSSLISVTGINNSGEIIGQGITTGGVKDGYVLLYQDITTASATPEPSTLVLAMLGLLPCAPFVRNRMQSAAQRYSR